MEKLSAQNDPLVKLKKRIDFERFRLLLMEFAILDRLSFMRFLGLTLSDKVPDAKTIWFFREQLTGKNTVEKLVDLFKEELQKKNLIANEGKIIDASFVEVPIQRNSREENKQIKQGEIPDAWKEKPNKLKQKENNKIKSKTRVRVNIFLDL